MKLHGNARAITIMGIILNSVSFKKQESRDCLNKELSMLIITGPVPDIPPV